MKDQLVKSHIEILNYLLRTKSGTSNDYSMYIEDIVKYTKTSFSIFQLSIMYMLRYIQQKSNIKINEYDLFMSCIIIAQKYYNDYCYYNIDIAKKFGIPNEIINKNEKIVLNVLQYDLYVNENTYKKWNKMIYEKDRIRICCLYFNEYKK